jgi:hypothetical protein
MAERATQGRNAPLSRWAEHAAGGTNAAESPHAEMNDQREKLRSLHSLPKEEGIDMRKIELLIVLASLLAFAGEALPQQGIMRRSGGG